MFYLSFKKKNISTFISLFFEHTFTSSHTFHSSPSFLTHFQLSPSFFFFSSQVAFAIQKKNIYTFQKTKNTHLFPFYFSQFSPLFSPHLPFFSLPPFPSS